LWGGLLVAVVGFLTASLLAKHFGTRANGIFGAGVAVTNIYSSFILGSIETDFFPRLSASNGLPDEMNRLILEQTELGLLLALPGVLGTIAFGPFLVSLFYSSQFQQAVEIIPLLTVATLGKILTSPLNYVPVALGSRRAMVTRDTLINLLQILLIWVCVPRFGAYGAALASALTYAIYFFTVVWMASRAISFSWNARMRRLLAASGVLVVVAWILAAKRAKFVSWETVGLSGLLIVGAGVVGFLLSRRIAEGGGFGLPIRLIRKVCAWMGSVVRGAGCVL
jgi:PST family polysaccharide transporter